MPGIIYEEFEFYEEHHTPPTQSRPAPPPDYERIKYLLKDEQYRVLLESGYVNNPKGGYYWHADRPNHTYVAQLLHGMPQWFLATLVREGIIDSSGTLMPHPETGRKMECKPSIWR